MSLDIRVPIGLLFTILGVLLVAYGLVSDPKIYAKSLDVNVNLWWGLAMAAFGGLMLFFGMRRRTAKPSETA